MWKFFVGILVTDFLYTYEFKWCVYDIIIKNFSIKLIYGKNHKDNDITIKSIHLLLVFQVVQKKIKKKWKISLKKIWKFS